MSCPAMARAHAGLGAGDLLLAGAESKKGALLPRPSYGGYVKLAEVAGKSRTRSLRSNQGSVLVSAKLGGILRQKPGESKVVNTPAPSNSGTVKLSMGGTQKLAGTLKLLFGGADDRPARELPRDDSLVFVAGATGRVGSRLVRELVKMGFKVRAGTRNPEMAEAEFADVIEGSSGSGLLGKLFGGKRKQVEIIEVNLENPETLEEAIGAAGKVVCTIGASESDALNITGPYRIDGQATKNLIKAAKELDVNQFVLVSSLGTEKFGFPASLLNLFWGVLIWKAQAEKELKNSGIAFTIVRPGGMERPTDEYKLTHNLRLAPPASLAGGQVSNLQIAELISTILKNPEISENKVVEAVAETSAPLRSIEEMLEELPVVGPTQAERLELLRKQAEEAAKQEEEQEALEAQMQQEERIAEAKRSEAEKAELERKQAQEKQAVLRAKLADELAAAKEKQKVAQEEAESSAAEKAELEKRREELKAKAAAAAQAAQELKALQDAVMAAAKQGKMLSPQEKDAVLGKVRASFAQSEMETTSKKATNSLSASKSQLFGSIAPWGKAAEVAKAAEKATVDVVTPTEISKSKAVEETVQVKKKPMNSAEEARAAAEKKVKEKLAKLEVEGKAKREAEDKAEVERIVKAKAEEEKVAAEAKAKADAEEKMRAEEEAKVKAIAEAAEKKKQEEEEAKVKAIAEAAEKKKQEEEEAKVKAIAEAAEKKKQEEEEAKVKAIAEAAEKKKQEEEEAKVKAIAEAAEKKKKEEEEAKANAAAEAAAAKKKQEEEVAEERERLSEKEKLENETVAAPQESSAFRWPWQQASPKASMEEKTISASSEPSASAPPQASVEEKSAPADSTDFPPSPTPLSPYAMYEDMKPPTSPTPLPNTSPVSAATEEKVTEAATATSSTDFPPSPTPLSPYTMYEDMKPPTSPTPLPNTSPLSAATEEKVTEAATATSSTDFPPSPTPLSPYTMYEDMKPPTSPTPLPNTSPLSAITEEKVTEAAAPTSSTDFPPSPSPLSPYTMYEDMKPPTSPTPLPNTSPLSSITEEKVTEATAPTSSTDFPPSPTPLSPYTLYPDVKPPTSPTPQASLTAAVSEKPAAVKTEEPPPPPVEAAPAVATATSTTTPVPPRQKWVAPSPAAETKPAPPAPPPKKMFTWPWGKEDASPKVEGKSSTDLPYANRPLSPYTMFPDLRPPSSPIPYRPGDDM